MRKKQLLLTAAAITAIPAMAFLSVNRNALGNSPVISKEFSKPPAETETPKGVDLKSSEPEDPQKVPVRALSAPEGIELPPIIASVYDYQTGTIGMYSLPEVSGGDMERVSDISSYYGGSLHGNLYYACHDGRYEDYWETDSDPHGHRIQAYDIKTWQPLGNEIYLSTYRAGDLAIDPATGTGYAFCDYGSLMFHFYSINLQTGEQTDLTPNANFVFSDDSRALAFDSEGTLYGVTKGGKFGKVDLQTGVNSAICDLKESGDLQHGWTGTFDPDSGNFLFMYNGSPDWGSTHESRLYSINPESGEYTLLADFKGKCITSMFVSPENVSDGAPAVPEELSGDFAGGSLAGTLTFTMPSTLCDGSPASGSASWRVLEGKEEIASGTAAYGATVNAAISVAEAGRHTFVITASNAQGESKKARLSMWIGPDVPAAPDNINVDFDENADSFTVTWDAVTAGVNGGYVDPDAITYTVRRLPADVVVAENISSASATCVYEPEGIESVIFSVTAAQGALVSDPGVSTPVMSGALALPYDLAEAERYHLRDNWTIIDSNEDGRTWDSNSYDGIYYSYTSADAADDWAVTPPIKAFKGCKYRIHAAFSCQLASCPEKIEVKAGYAPSAEAMTVTLLQETLIDQSDPMPFDFEFTPDRDGKLFIGFHAVSDANMYKLKIVELTITAPVNEAAPAAPVITELTADRGGALRAEGRVTVPALAENGSSLASVSRLEVTRNGTTVTVIDNPAPGETVGFSDLSVPEDGEYTYEAVAYNGDMKGSVSDQFKTFVGINRPADLDNITIVRAADDPSKVTVSWDAPATDWLGYPLNGEVTYCLEVFPDNAYYHGNHTYENIEGESYTFTPTFDSGLDHGFVYVKVRAANSAGQCYANKSANIFAGRPLTLPFKESFPNYTLEHPWGDGESNGPKIGSISDDERALALQQYNGWNRLMDASFQNSEGSQDHDNGFAGMFGWSYVNDESGNYHNEWTELLSPAIDLSGVDNPALSFYTYNWHQYGNPDLNELDIYAVTSDGTRHLVSHLVIGQLGDIETWEHVALDLADFKGQTVSFIFKGTIKANGEQGYNWILIDNITIDRLPATDLAVSDISAPVQAVPNEAFEVTARVTNFGSSDVAAHKAILYHNGVEAAVRDLGPLGFSKNENIGFTHSLGVQDPVGNVFKIVIEVEGDEVLDNNTSAEVTVARNLKLLPEPENVYINPEGACLEWKEPDYSKAVPEAFTDDFESYPLVEKESFLTEAGDWIFIDVDQAPIGGMISSSTWEMINFPGIPTHSAQSWWVQSRLFEEFSDTYYGYDNSLQYLANMYVVNDSYTAGVQQDDWAITPELCGREQLVTLWARSYNRSTPETVEFLYSEGSTDPQSFRLIRRIEELPGDWTQYALVVPEGGRRFAIRGCSYAVTGTAQTFIDNVTFYPAAGSPQDLDLKGYHIYCDNSLLTPSPVKDLEYVELPSGNNNYAVSAVYATGESRAVKAIEGSGIEGIRGNGVSVTSSRGMIIIDRLEGAAWRVNAVSGMTVASGSGDGHVEIPVAQGVYIVSAANRTVKIAVR